MVSTLRLMTAGVVCGVALGIVYSLIQSMSDSARHTASHSFSHLHPLRRSNLAAAGGAAGGAEAGGGGDAAARGGSGGGSEEEAVHRVEEKKKEEEVERDEPLARVCGSPAVDGYAHVDPKCLEASPTNQLWWRTHGEGQKSGEGLECNVEYAVSLDGLAVGWGIGNKKPNPEACCQACRDHVPGPHVGGPFGNLPCNVWVYCNAPECFEADAHKHTQGDCWLKFSEAPQSPEVNARGDFSADFRKRHPDSPPRCQWVSGVLVPLGQVLTNGTWGPRYSW